MQDKYSMPMDIAISSKRSPNRFKTRIPQVDLERANRKIQNLLDWLRIMRLRSIFHDEIVETNEHVYYRK